MNSFFVGNLYFYRNANKIALEFPFLEFSEKDKTWTLSKQRNYLTMVKDETPCVYIGKTNSIRIGAFLVGQRIVGLELDKIFEK